MRNKIIKRLHRIHELRMKQKTYKEIAEILGIKLITLSKFRQRYDKKNIARLKRIDWNIGNQVCISANGYLMFLGQAGKWIEIRNKDLRRAIGMVYHFQNWQINL